MAGAAGLGNTHVKTPMAEIPVSAEAGTKKIAAIAEIAEGSAAVKIDLQRVIVGDHGLSS